MILFAALLLALNAAPPAPDGIHEPERLTHVITLNLWELVGTSLGIEYEQAVLPWMSIAVEVSPRFQLPGEWGFHGFFGGAARASIRGYPFGRAPWGLAIGVAYSAGATFEGGEPTMFYDGTVYENKALALTSFAAANVGWSWCVWKHFVVNIAAYVRPDVRLALGGAF